MRFTSNIFFATLVALVLTVSCTFIQAQDNTTTSTSTMAPPPPTYADSCVLFTLTANTTVDLKMFSDDLANLIQTDLASFTVSSVEQGTAILVTFSGSTAAANAQACTGLSASQLMGLKAASVQAVQCATMSTTSTTVSETSSTSVSVTETTISTSTTAATTTTPTPTIPSVYLLIKLTNSSVAATAAQKQEFLNKLAALLGIDASLLSIDLDASNSTALTVKITAANATEIGNNAVNLNSDALASLGATSIEETTPPTPTTAEPEKKKLNIPLIAGCAAGGFVLLLIILYVAKKKSSSGTGSHDAGHVNLGPDGTTFRRMEDELKTHREHQQSGGSNVL